MSHGTVTPEQFALWLKHSRPGDRLSYHIGHLAVDREKTVNIGGSAAPRWVHQVYEPMDSVAKASYAAYRAGKVLLVQEKVEDHIFNYVAIRTKS